jgi:presenilin-like A22 family membrane protease
MNKLKVLFSELSIFAIIQFLGIYIGSLLLVKMPEFVQAPQISLTIFLSIFLLSVTMIFLAMRFMKNKYGFKLLFVFLIVIGSKTVFSAFVSDFYANILALIIVALWVAIPYVLMHNIALIFAISGISTEIGFSLSLSTILFLFGVLSIYDVIAVYKTKHMVKMFTGLMERGLLLSLIIPITKSWLSRTSDVKPKAGYLLLGTGDIAFPLILAVSVLKISMVSAIFVAIGSIIGAALVFYLLINQQSRRAIPALPPIALCSIAGFVISLLV